MENVELIALISIILLWLGYVLHKWQIKELQHKIDTLQGFLDHDIEYDMDKQLTEAKKYISFLLGVVHIKNTYNKEIEEEIAKAEAFLKGR